MTPYYDEGGVTIYHGDSLEILPTIAAGSVHMVCTDPPYVIGAVSSGALASKSGGWQDMMNSAAWFASWYRETVRPRSECPHCHPEKFLCPACWPDNPAARDEHRCATHEPVARSTVASASQEAQT